MFISSNHLFKPVPVLLYTFSAFELFFELFFTCSKLKHRRVVDHQRVTLSIKSNIEDQEGGKRMIN
jgi:uncharacterized membrane protein